MVQIGTVLPDDGLFVRRGPGTEHESMGALEKGEEVTLIEKIGDWWGVQSRLGLGFIHGGFISITERPEPPAATAPGVEATYTCVSGDTLMGIGLKLGLDFREIAALNGLVDPFVIRVGQVLRLPGSEGTAGRSATERATTTTTARISILNPLEFAGETEVTSSSLQGHHTPFLGACSCDLDIRGASSPGTPVRFNVSGPPGVELRGVVRELGLACVSRQLSDGGRTVKLAIERREAGGDWSGSGSWVLYAHLDPVSVHLGDVVGVGGVVGALGPSGGGEYHSSCATASHVHVEAAGARCIANKGSVIRDAAVMTLNG